jgi:hypothetical protein
VTEILNELYIGAEYNQMIVLWRLRQNFLRRHFAWQSNFDSEKPSSRLAKTQQISRKYVIANIVSDENICLPEE